GDVLGDDVQAVQNRRGRDDGGTVLVIVEHGNAHALAQLLLDVEALGGLDVFQVHTTQGGFQCGNDVDQLVRIGFVQLDIEHIDAGEFLEQAAFAFHDRLGGQRADIAQTQHGGPVGDHGNQVGARGVLGGGFFAFGVDGHASRCDAGRVG